MKRKHYILSVEIGGVTNYAVRNLACIVGYKLTTDESKAETFGESIKKKWLAQYPSGSAVEVGDEKRPDLEELRQIKRELHGPAKPRAKKFGPKPPPKFGPVKPRAVKFGPRKPGPADERGTVTYSQPAKDPRRDPGVGSLKSRAEKVLGWKKGEAEGFSHHAIRELLRGEGERAEQLIKDFDRSIRSGAYIVQQDEDFGPPEMFRKPADLSHLLPKLSSDSPFAIVYGDEKPPAGYELVTAERVPGNLTKEQTRAWLKARTSRIPALPLGKGIAWYDEKVAEAANAAFDTSMFFQGAVSVHVYFKPVEDAPLSTEKFAANLRVAPVGTVVLWTLPYEKSKRVYKKVGGLKFDWREIMPGYEGWRVTPTKGERILSALLQQYHQNPRQFEIVFPSDPRAKGYEIERRLSEERQILQAEASEIDQQEQAKKAREAEREKMAREVDAAIKESRQKENIARSEKAKERANIIWDRAVPAARAEMLEKVRTKRPLSSIRGLEGESYDTLNALEYLATMRPIWQDSKGNDQRTPKVLHQEKLREIAESHPESPAWDREQIAKRVSNEPLRQFWDSWHTWASRKNTMEHDVRAAELALRVKKYGALRGKARLKFDAPEGFITYANNLKAHPYLVNLPTGSIVRVEGEPTKGFKNPTMVQFILNDDGSWSSLSVDSRNNWKAEKGNFTRDLEKQIANAKRSEIHVIRPGTKEHDRYMDKARDSDDVTPAVLELLREYMGGSRKKDAPGGVIRRYIGSDFHLLSRALSAGLIERASASDKEGVKLTKKGEQAIA